MTDIEKLDEVFSEYIRLRDADQYGMVRCISCGKRMRWTECDAGHYVSRSHMCLRYDEKNVNEQCRECNRFKSGNPEGYERGLRIKYGRFVLEYEIEMLTLYYKKQVKILRMKYSI